MTIDDIKSIEQASSAFGIQLVNAFAEAGDSSL